MPPSHGFRHGTQSRYARRRKARRWRRARGIDDIEAANAYLPEFAADHNRRFAVAPREAEDAHRPVLHDAGELALILSEHPGIRRADDPLNHQNSK